MTGEAGGVIREATGKAERATYGAMPPPGARLPGPGAYRIDSSPERFAVLSGHIGNPAVLQFGGERHRRVRHEAGDDFAGRRLAP